MLTQERQTYKPFQYPWAYEAWEQQQKMHWLPEEVPLGEDVKDWSYRLTEQEKHLLTQVFRFFTQADIEVNNCYHQHYLNVFKPTEVKMMLTAFSNMETIHVAAYSHLLDTVGMPETEYEAFLKYKEMQDKVDHFHSFDVEDPFNTARTMAAFGAFTEGLQLFASFAILMNFPRFNKMKGMGQIVSWSVRDETLHCNSIIKLFQTFVQENHIDVGRLEAVIRSDCYQFVRNEDAFIDLVFEMGDVEGLSAQDVKNYIRYIANMRFSALYPLADSPYPEVAKNPLPWLEEVLNGVEFVNFFEQRATDYSKAATKGSWDEVFNEVDERSA